MSEKISIYDTTLRDGNQASGINLSLNDKIKVAVRLDSLGIDYIEGGWPNPSNKTDIKFYKEIEKENLSSSIAAFGSTKRPGTKCENDRFMQMLIGSSAPVATIYGKSWDLHVSKVIKCSLEENLEMIHDSVQYLKKYFDEVVFDAEHYFDGFIKNREYALKSITAAEEAGADAIVLCDTNGGILPGDFREIYEKTNQALASSPGVHLHNDSGCAVANSIIAAESGARHIQGTFNGMGERCGNADLCAVIPNLELKLGFKVLGRDRLKRITPASFYINEIANLASDPHKPFVGEAAFSHKGGAHIDGVKKESTSFEHISPELVGNKRSFVISNQSGSSAIVEKIKNIYPELNKKDKQVKDILARIKTMENNGYHLEAADATFYLIVQSVIENRKEPFQVKGFRVIEEKYSSGEVHSEATIKIQEKEVKVHTAAEGDGPVNALDNALRKALIEFYPSIKDVRLEDFKVRVLDGTEGTAARVRVLIESADKDSRWGTVGVSENIIEASWIALVDSLKYKLYMDGVDL